jgi:two-component system NtrC family sensor kinase
MPSPAGRIFDLSRFALSDMIECGTILRKLGTNAQSMEEAATSIVRFIYASFIDPKSGSPACALVRYFKTHSYAELGPDLEKFAGHALGGQSATPTTRCLTLLATAGDLPEWNDRRRSSGHQAIPLASEKVVEQAPMIARLIQQFGLDISTVITPEHAPLMVLEQKTYNVFHVHDAQGSPYVPAQKEFVVPHNIKSVLGFGGLFPNGDLFAVILFSKVSIPKETADMFSTLALGIKLAVLPFFRGPIFSEARGPSH